MGSLFDAVDNYCERTAEGLLGEPLNAISNISFFIAAWLLYKIYRSSNSRDTEVRNLIGCLTVVGCGSLTFHMVATRITMWADVIPIIVFVIYYLWVALRRLTGWTYIQAFLGCAAFLFLLVKAYDIPAPYNFNGSSAYFPCLVAIGVIASYIRTKFPAAANLLFKAFVWLTLSLTLRSIDIAVCSLIPMGTHFLWHLCNGLVLYLLTRAIIDTPARTAN